MKQIYSILLSLCMMLFVALMTSCDSSMLDPDKVGDETSLISLDNVEVSGPQIALKRRPIGEEKYSDIYNLNLFNSDRTYVESDSSEEKVEPTQTPKRTTVDLPNFELIGTLTSSESDNIAFIKNSKAEDKSKRNKALKYISGDWLGDYMISVIKPDKVVLTRGEELAYLRLKPPKNLRKKPSRKPRSKTSKNAARGKSQSVDTRKSRARSNEERRKGEGVNPSVSGRSSTQRTTARSGSRSNSRDSKSESRMRGSKPGCGR
ncbi:hypothetical protein K8T06_05450 [bacterium]|nr:hypothetical protein [bacterium]